MVKQKLGLFGRLVASVLRCYQDRVADWDAVAFAKDPTDLAERRDRFLEEGLELVQSLGGTREDAHLLVDYVFGRPVGVPHQEMGGTMVCLAALAEYASLDMDRAGEDELARCWRPEVIEKIQRKRAGRHGRGPLPGFSFPDEPRVPARALIFSGGDTREALKPFVAHYQPWMDNWADTEPCTVFARVTFGDLRRARAIIEAAPSG